jgi:hypothetical protein
VNVFNNKGEKIFTKDGNNDRVFCPVNRVMEHSSLEELKQTGGLHKIHNHPFPLIQRFREDDRMLATCLSKGDFIAFFGKADIRGEGKDYYVYKSTTCQCNNGSRMTLIRHTDDFDKEAVLKEGEHLRENYYKVTGKHPGYKRYSKEK